MRIILKIIAASFVLALILAVAVLSFLSCIAGAFCWLACTALVLLAACGFFAGRVYCHAGAGVFGFPLWAPGHRGVAAGAPVWGEICLAGFYV